ncbi:MAG: hypothetical protein NC299_06175 [Lachnospiraceae bacterium]|nr:hypothetical protein [Ruminococcus sp.]MCM1274940.1 hypothetical protein [Lachnospiraceae bacterium]
MKKSKLAASLLAVTVSLSTLLAGCTTVPDTSSGDSSSSSSSSSSSNGGGNTDSTSSDNGGNSDPAPEAPKLEYASGTVLRMATGYNSPDTGLFFEATYIESKGKDGVITLADGKSYSPGDLKPTWAAIEELLDVKFENKYQGSKNASAEWEYWKEQLDQVDMVCGSASGLNEAGAAGLVVDLAQYLDQMPDFKAYLDANPIVRLSIAGDDGQGGIGGIYFAPYFDGVDDIERMPLMRVDWVQKLLDGDGAFAADSSGNTAAPVYQPYMPTSGKVQVQVVEKDGKTVKTIEKNYDKAGNIVKNMNDAGSMTGVDAVNMLRKYIDEAYDGYYGATRSDLFCGQNAAWDADELVALVRCVCANAPTLNGKDSVQGIFSREDDNNQRRVDMMRFAGTLFGVRGLESRKDYLYVGNDNKLHDARQEEDAYKAMEMMNALTQEGLISKSFIDMSKESTQTMLENDLGFMHYDYNQTQTAYNATKLQDGEMYMAVMVPVARWNDGTGEQYMRFTESWRSVKTDAWAISKAGVEGNTDKLNAALSLINYAFSEEGQIMMSYGPEVFRKSSTFTFNGKEMPEISDAAYEELWAKENGNYTNYGRKCLGSTLSFVKSQAFEYQCTHEVGKIGAGYISNAIAAGTIKHPELALADNPWYTSVPTVLPLTKAENDTIAGYTELGSNGKFSTSKEQSNLFVDIIVKGYSGEGTGSAAECAATVANSWNGAQYLSLNQGAWDILVDEFANL